LVEVSKSPSKPFSHILEWVGKERFDVGQESMQQFWNTPLMLVQGTLQGVQAPLKIQNFKSCFNIYIFLVYTRSL
jgi:hypothetical protein